MYHCVYSQCKEESGFQFPTSYPYKIDAKKFEDHIISVIQACKQNRKPVDDVVFSFDDGGVSFYNVIAPILEKYGLKGLFFISTQFIDTDKFLTRAQIRELKSRDHIIASHTHSHPLDLSRLSYDEILNEWKTSKTILEDIINEPISTASIPNGRGSKLVVQAAKEAGFKVLYTSVPTIKFKTEKGITLIGRFVIRYNDTSDFVQNIILKPLTRIKLYIKWWVLNVVKKILGSNYRRLKRFLNV